MPSRDPGHDRSLQDDRADLGVDAEDRSPLVKGEGAPLAENDAATTEAEQPVNGPAMLGGAPVPAPIEVDPSGRVPAPDPMTASDERPINN